MTDREFYDLCAGHDWFHTMAGDFCAYKKGEKERANLLAIVADDKRHAEMFNDWVGHVSYRRARPVFQQEVN